MTWLKEDPPVMVTTVEDDPEWTKCREKLGEIAGLLKCINTGRDVCNISGLCRGDE